MATVADVRLQAHAMIDRMAPRQVSAVVTLLEAMLDPVSRALANAPVEDERVDAEETEAVAASRKWLSEHEPISNREVLAEFGLSEDDFERMGQTPLPADR
jgi:hypothetical protein